MAHLAQQRWPLVGHPDRFRLAPWDLGTGRVMTLDADDERALRDQLATQVILDGELER